MRRRFRLFVFASFACAIATSAIAACSSTPTASNGLPVEDDDGGRRRDRGNVPDSTEPPPDSGPTPGRIYAHTRDELYLFEPIAKTISFIGKFSCVPDDDSVLDIALDRTGQMYGTTYERFISINPLTASCTVIQEQGLNFYPNSLSFVPQGTVDPAEEALVGYAFDPTDDHATLYTRIDLQNGTMKDLSDLNPSGAAVKYALAGDLISLVRSSNKTYGIIKQVGGDGGIGKDKLAEIDPSTGKLKTILGDLGYEGTYGFGYWAGKGYGFLSDGRVIEIDMTNGSSTVVATLTSDGAPAAWYGAGVTTDSPTR